MVCMQYAGLTFMTFETLKTRLRERYGFADDSDIPTAWRLAAGAFAGLLGQSATYVRTYTKCTRVDPAA